MGLISDWFRRHFSDPQVVLLAVLLAVGFTVVLIFGRMLAPAIAALIIAFVLDRPVMLLRGRGVPNVVATSVVFVGFLGVASFVVLTILPLVLEQVTELVRQLPSITLQIQDAVLALPERYPSLFDEAQVAEIIAALRAQILNLGEPVLQYSLASITSLVTVVVYVILGPLLVFFFLKDKEKIIQWFSRFLPSQRRLVNQVWKEVNQKIGAYIRGKVYEIMIVGVVTWLTFTVIGLDFAILLALATGFSVLIPYIGAAAVFFPVAAVAFFQWGPGGDFVVAIVAYGIIQGLDGNLLAPLLFAEIVKLHASAIVVAILIFGGIWGFWGLFFAIPLATLAHEVIKAWPGLPGPLDETVPEATQSAE
jgi:putative permease